MSVLGSIKKTVPNREIRSVSLSAFLALTQRLSEKEQYDFGLTLNPAETWSVSEVVLMSENSGRKIEILKRLPLMAILIRQTPSMVIKGAIDSPFFCQPRPETNDGERGAEYAYQEMPEIVMKEAIREGRVDILDFLLSKQKTLSKNGESLFYSMGLTAYGLTRADNPTAYACILAEKEPVLAEKVFAWLMENVDAEDIRTGLPSSLLRNACRIGSVAGARIALSHGAQPEAENGYDMISSGGVYAYIELAERARTLNKKESESPVDKMLTEWSETVRRSANSLFLRDSHCDISTKKNLEFIARLRQPVLEGKLFWSDADASKSEDLYFLCSAVDSLLNGIPFPEKRPRESRVFTSIIELSAATGHDAIFSGLCQEIAAKDSDALFDTLVRLSSCESKSVKRFLFMGVDVLGGAWNQSASIFGKKWAGEDMACEFESFVIGDVIKRNACPRPFKRI